MKRPTVHSIWLLTFLLAASLPNLASGQQERLTPYQKLPPAHQAYVDQLLQFWEHSSSKIKQYRCSFTRWEHDTTFGPKNAAKTIARGRIRYKNPDRGLFEVQEFFDYAAPQQSGGQANYAKRETDNLEKWICDGKSVFEFDAARKRVLERQLPKALQGRAIVDGPVPFLFGAKADKIKSRYWLQVITPKKAQNEYWLEAWPWKREDRASFQKVEIIIDEKDFLPKAIQIYDPNYDPRRGNLSRTAFEFKDRQVNPIDLRNLDKLQLFHRAFDRPKTPSGWKKEVIPMQTAGSPAPDAAAAARTARAGP